MSEDSDELLTGRASNEAVQGWTEMQSADPIPTEDPGLDLNDPAVKHLRRDAEPLEEVSREYYGPDGKPTPERQSVTPEQAGRDLSNIRNQEREALQAERNRELDEALRAHEAGREPQQPAQQDQPQPETFVEPQLETMNSDAAHAEADAAWKLADEQITEFLKNDHIRERIQAEYDGVKNAAAAEARQEVERAHNLSAAARDHYVKATNNLVAEANGIIGVLYPELNGLNPDQMQGALRIMQQQQPERVQALSRLASRAAGLVEAQQRQQHEAAQGQALQRDAALEQYTSANVKEYENWSARENPETMKSIRENLKPIVEKQYGVPMQTLQAIHDGKLQMDATAFVRSAAFQKMLHDSIKYNLAARAVTEARSNPIPRVQRPGVASAGPTADPGEIAAASMAFNRPGGNIGRDGLRNAAALITAKRAGR